MALIKFNDECIISRAMLDDYGDVMYNEHDEPMIEQIYNGPCCYQAGGQANLSILVRNDVVYLPFNNEIVYSGDMIEVKTSRGRNRIGVVNLVRDIDLPLSGGQFTKIEIKQTMGE